MYGRRDFLLYDGRDILLYDGVMYDGGVRCPFEKLRSKNGFARRTTASRRSADRIPERECPAFHTHAPMTNSGALLGVAVLFSTSK